MVMHDADARERATGEQNPFGLRQRFVFACLRLPDRGYRPHCRRSHLYVNPRELSTKKLIGWRDEWISSPIERAESESRNVEKGSNLIRRWHKNQRSEEAQK